MMNGFGFVKRAITWPRDNTVPTSSIFTKVEESPMGIPFGLRSRMSFIEFHPSAVLFRWPDRNADAYLTKAKAMLEAAVAQDRVHQHASEGAAKRLAVVQAPSQIICQLYESKIIAVAAISLDVGSLEHATGLPERSRLGDTTLPASQRE
jgi:hypothetical protein